MAGTITNGFDMVIEVSSETIQNILKGIFDSDGFLGSIFPSSLPLNTFTLDLNFNRPPDVAASATNPLELMLNLTFSGGITGQFRIVAGLDVDRTQPDTDWVIIDFPNKLYVCDITLNGINIPGVDGFLRNKLDNNPVKLIPIPVDRGSTNSFTIIRADVKVIDDSTAANLDALGVMLTFGGGAAGNINAFSSAFSREGAGAAVAINFAWLCRNISPRVETAIGLPGGSFSGCSFNGDHEIRDGVRLTSLSISPTADSIRLSGTVAKSGFCYEASGTIGANIFVAVETGELRVRFTVDNPDIDVNIPWYCWLAGAVIGAVIGGIIGGIIGAIVGGILVPLIIWIAQSVVESTVQNIADEITGAIGGVNLNVPLVGISTILDRAFIDDLTISYNMYPDEYAEIKSQGTLVVRAGQFFDLDNGIVRDASFGGADFELRGSGYGRTIKALCGTSLANFYSTNFNHIRRFNAYELSFGLINEVPLNAIAIYVPIPFFDDLYYENYRIFGAKTSDNCYSFFQVVNITDDLFYILYKTYVLEAFTLSITGNFLCNPTFASPKHVRTEGIEYIQSSVLNTKFSDSIKAEAMIRLSSADIYAKAKSVVVAPAIDNIDLSQKIQEYNRPVGKWINKNILVRDTKSARFKASVNGNVTVTTYNWAIDGSPLAANAQGTIKVKGVSFNYKVENEYLIISSNSSQEVEIPIKVTVLTSLGSTETTIRCVKYKNECRFERAAIPNLSDYLNKFDREYGIKRVPVPKRSMEHSDKNC